MSRFVGHSVPAHLRAGSSRPDARASSRPESFTRFRRVSPASLAETTRSLAVVIDARIPVVQALAMVRDQCEDKRLSTILTDIVSHVRRGQNLATALKAHPRTFSSLFVQLVAIGEQTGLLGQVLTRLADYLETSNAVAGKVRSALAYPVLIVSVATAATLFLLIVVVPTFSDMYRDYNAELPVPTQVLVSISSFVLTHAIELLIAAVCLCILIVRLIGIPDVRKVLERSLLRIPVLSGFLRLHHASRFTRNLGTLVSHHIPLADSVSLLKGSVSFSPLRDVIEHIETAVISGKSMSGILNRQRIFSSSVAQMIAVGEETGRLGEMLLHIAQHLEADVERRTESMLSLMEPAIILIVGIVLGGILIALYLPLFELSQVVG